LTRILLFITVINLSSKQNIKNHPLESVSINKEFFGKTKDGQDVFQFEMKNKKGMIINIISYGGIITSWRAKNRNNHIEDIVLGYNTLKEYENNSPYFGAIIGRYGNRIAKGKFSLEGKEYNLETNNYPNHLHGGVKGFDKVVWQAREILTDSTSSLELSYLSEDGEQGYPGNLKVKVIYTLNNNDELIVEYFAETDKTTIVNFTQHSYFNLSGNFQKDILGHELVINADNFLPVDSNLIPTGEIRKVNTTPFDFRIPKKNRV